MQYVVVNGQVRDQNGNVGVLYSKAYRAPWLAVKKEHYKTLMFYPPLVLFMVSGGNTKDLVAGFSGLTEKGKELIGDLFKITGKISFMEDIKYLCLEWVPLGKMFRIVQSDHYEKVEYFDKDDWIINE